MELFGPFFLFTYQKTFECISRSDIVTECPDPIILSRIHTRGLVVGYIPREIGYLVQVSR